MFELRDWVVPHVMDAMEYSTSLGELAESNPELARMCLNENPFPPSEKVVAALAEGGRRGNRYPGLAKDLKTKLGAMSDLGPENVFLAHGSSEIIDSMMRAFLMPGDEILLPDPTFSLFKVRASVAGAKIVGVPFEGDDLDYSLQNYLDRITDKTKLILVVTPNNPTGAFFDPDDMRKLLDEGIPTCIDEAYLEFHPDVPSFAPVLADYPNAFISHTLSKAYGLAGLRFGYLLARPELVEVFRKLAQPWNVSQQTLAAAMAALVDEESLERNVEFMTSWMRRFDEKLRSLGLRPLHWAGNFMLVDASASGKTAKEIFQAGQEAGIILKPMGAIRGNESFFRITPGTEEENLRTMAFFDSYFG